MIQQIYNRDQQRYVYGTWRSTQQASDLLPSLDDE
jgi:hypothetical protein